MPSEYPSKQEVRNRLRLEGQERPSETNAPVPGRAGSRTVMSGLVQRLARELGRSSEELAAQIDPDTIRRTKYPVFMEKLPDGTVLYKDDPGIIEGRKSA